MTDTIEIYEFSRAFDNVQYSDNYQKWVSGGYALEKINCFNNNIPAEIKKLVTTNYFSLNDSYPPKDGDVALVGCDLDNYSLLAVANGQIDDGGRPTIGYRYFWLEKQPDNSEIDGVGTLLFWWNSQLEKPQFEMERARFQEIPDIKLTQYIITRENFAAEFAEAIANILSDRLVPYTEVVNHSDSWLQKYPDSIQCHYIAYYLTLDSDRYVAWAWNVRRLIYPENFISIYSTTERDIPSVNKVEITNIIQENSQETIKKIQQNSEIEECLKDIESRFVAKKSLERTGKLPELLSYLEAEERYNFNINQKLYNNSEIYRSLLALILPEETENWLKNFLQSDDLEPYKLSLSLHKQLFQVAKEQNHKAYEYLYGLVSVHIYNLLLELIPSRLNYKLTERIKYLLSDAWQLPFKEYGQNLEIILVNLQENQEPNQNYDKFHKYVLNILQEIKTKLRNQDKLFNEGNRFTAIINLFQENKLNNLASLFKFFNDKKLDKNTPAWLSNFVTPANIKVKLKTKSHPIQRLFYILFLQPVNTIKYIILLPITILTGANESSSTVLSNNDDSKFPKAAFIGGLFILIGAAIVFCFGYNNPALMISIVIWMLGVLILLIGAVIFRGSDMLSKLIIAIIMILFGIIIYRLGYSYHLLPSQKSSMKYIVNWTIAMLNHS